MMLRALAAGFKTIFSNQLTFAVSRAAKLHRTYRSGASGLTTVAD